jgi:hypothetical protein
MTKITLMLLLGASIVSAGELDINKQVKKDVEVKPKLLYFNSLDGSQKVDKFGSSNKSEFARYENSTLLIENNDPQKKANVCGKWLKIPEGKKILFSVLVKAENVTSKQIKFGLMINDSKGKRKWPSARIGTGTFGWRKVSFSTVVPLGVNRCLLFYGLQSGTGKVYFKDIKVVIIE